MENDRENVRKSEAMCGACGGSGWLLFGYSGRERCGACSGRGHNGYELVYLSFGAGVQSTALYYLSALGLRGVPRADVAIFADTQAEPAYVNDHLEDMKNWARDNNGLPIRVVTRGSLFESIAVNAQRTTGRRGSRIPLFTKEIVDGKVSKGMLQRNCTWDYKIEVLKKEARRLLGVKRFDFRRRFPMAIAMIGISTDEADRMKPSRERWITNLHPLLDARMNRSDCEAFIRSLGRPVPRKSACIFCPFHSDQYWATMKAHEPTEFARAVEVDRLVRKLPMMRSESYLHASRKPLEEVEFKAAPETFSNECSGICGV